MRAKTTLYLFLLPLLLVTTAQAQTNTTKNYTQLEDSLFQELKLATSTIDSIDLLNAISFSARRTSSEATIKYAQQALHLSDSIDYKNGLVLAYKHIGIGYFRKGFSPDSVIYFSRKALKIAEEIDDYYNQAACNNNIGLVQRQLRSYALALEYFGNGIEIFEKHIGQDEWLYLLMLGNLGALYSELDNLEKANYYLEKVINLSKKYGHKSILSLHYDDYAKMKLKSGELEKTQAVIAEGKNIQQEIEDYGSFINLSIVEGELYEEKKDTTAANLTYNNAYNLSIKYGFQASAVEALIGLINVSINNNVDRAFEYSKQALEITSNNNNIRLRILVLEKLSQIYALQENYEAAFLIDKEYITLIDSTNRLDKINYTTSVTAVHESRLKQQEIEALLLAQKEQRRKIIYIAALAILCIFSLFVLNNQNNALKYANRKALEASRAKQNFLSKMSHEIRTPMNAIIGFSEILLQKNPRKDQLTHLQYLQTSGQYLMTLLNDILHYSKLDAKKVKIYNVPFDLKQSLEILVGRYSLSNQNEEVEVLLEYGIDHLDHKLIGDSPRLNQILSNLMSNALKFTHNGYVKLKVSELEKRDDSVDVEFQVEDTGIGISYEKQQVIFDRFTQALGSSKKIYGGTGLGLAIVKELIKLLKGTIHLKSTVGRGSIFTIRLPLGISTLPLQSGEVLQSSYTSTHPLKKIKILIAEDNIFNQKVVVKILENYGASCAVAENGEEALKLLEDNDYDLILMDLYMPIMDGKQAIRAIRTADNAKRHIPIIVLTAAIEDELSEDPIFEDIESMSKPYKAEILLETILLKLNTHFPKNVVSPTTS